MIHFFKRAAVGALFAVVAFAAPAFAQDVTVGSLTLTNLWARATPPKAPTGAGYLTITNKGSEQDTLIAVSTPVAETSELHIMEVKNGIMTMHPVEGGIKIPAGGTVTLAPGGYHLMFIKLKHDLKQGETAAGDADLRQGGHGRDLRCPSCRSDRWDPAGAGGATNMDMKGGQMGTGK